MALPSRIDTYPIQQPPLDKLFVRTKERLRGPFDVSVLKAMQVRGEIQPDTLLSPDRTRWVTAISLPELFPSALFVLPRPTTQEEMLWHVMIEGQRQGPISWESLIELASSGKLRAMDLVTVDGGDNWVRTSTITGLIVAPDNGPSLIAQSKSSWLIGGGIGATLLLVIPAVLMMVWNEKRIGLSEFLGHREDTQEHDRRQLALQNASDEYREELRSDTDITVAEVTGTATVEAAKLEALAQGAKIAREQEQHNEKIAAERERTAQAASDAAESRRMAAEEAEKNRQQSRENTREIIDAMRED